jgi:hypothetical protein
MIRVCSGPESSDDADADADAELTGCAVWSGSGA